MAEDEYYQSLGVSKSASPEDIKRAYRKLAVRFHPDKNPGNARAEERFKKIGEAYEVLKDPEKRAAYDRVGHGAFKSAGRGAAGGGGVHDPFDIFREVFSAGGGGGGASGGIFEEFFGRAQSGGGRTSARGQPGSDLRYDMKIELEEAADGVEREINYRCNKSCGKCN